MSNQQITDRREINDQWQLLAPAERPFLLETLSQPVRIAYRATTPTADGPFHTIAPGELVPRGALRGAAWMAAMPGQTAVIMLTVSA